MGGAWFSAGWGGTASAAGAGPGAPPMKGGAIGALKSMGEGVFGAAGSVSIGADNNSPAERLSAGTDSAVTGSWNFFSNSTVLASSSALRLLIHSWNWLSDAEGTPVPAGASSKAATSSNCSEGPETAPPKRSAMSIFKSSSGFLIARLPVAGASSYKARQNLVNEPHPQVRVG